MISPFERATKADQYDLGDILWANVGKVDATRTGFFWEYMEPFTRDWAGKKILDIGAGTGWLLEKAKEGGAVKAVGIEPAKSTVEMARQDHPGIDLVNTTLEEFDAQGARFDRFYAIMSFSHIRDVDAAFTKIAAMSEDAAEIIIIVPDYDYFHVPRFDYTMEVQEIDAHQYAASIMRPGSGIIADIVRRSGVYIAAAERAGFECVEEKPMPPTETQMARSPKYVEVKGQSLSQLLHFKKV